MDDTRDSVETSSSNESGSAVLPFEGNGDNTRRGFWLLITTLFVISMGAYTYTYAANLNKVSYGQFNTQRQVQVDIDRIQSERLDEVYKQILRELDDIKKSQERVEGRLDRVIERQIPPADSTE